MFDQHANLTRTWVIFFERLASLAAEEVGAADRDRRVIVLEDTNTGARAIPLVQDEDVTLQYAQIITGPISGNTAQLIVDVFLDGGSIFGETKLVVPAGSPAGTIVTQDVFVSDPMSAAKDQVWTCRVLSGDGTTMASVIIPWV